jgi:hypothetical protein
MLMEGPGRQIKEQAEAVQAHPEVAAGPSRLSVTWEKHFPLCCPDWNERYQRS